MRYLLDTHILLWARLEPTRLKPGYREILEDPRTVKLISPITLWEISLKFSLKKLDLAGHNPVTFWETAQQRNYQLLGVDPETYSSFYGLPQVEGHNDPFDRMLIWQAIQEGVTLLSHDGRAADYQAHGLKLA